LGTGPSENLAGLARDRGLRASARAWRGVPRAHAIARWLRRVCRHPVRRAHRGLLRQGRAATLALAQEMTMTAIELVERYPTVDEYRRLISSVGLEAARHTGDLTSASSLFAVFAEAGREIVGMGRVIGDGGLHYYLTNVVVLPAHQHQGLSSRAGAGQGPYPIGKPSAQPDLNVAFPAAETRARYQSFRMILKPEIWAREARLRFSNALGAKPVTFDAVFIGLHLTSSALVPGTNRPVTFSGKRTITIAPGDSTWSDAVALPFVRDPGSSDLAGRKLAVSFHVPGESGPMTWHAKALQTSYVSMPGASAKSQDESESVFPIS